MKFAMTHIAKSGKIEGLQRIDRYEVPLEAIRESIVNAIVHRDYSISGVDLKFAIFDDRIEITSPGCLPRSLEIEDIMAGRSEIRNKVIARFFKEIGFIEQWGTGMRKMVNLCASANLPEPVNWGQPLICGEVINGCPSRNRNTIEFLGIWEDLTNQVLNRFYVFLLNEERDENKL